MREIIGIMLSPGMNNIVQITGVIPDFNSCSEDPDVIQQQGRNMWLYRFRVMKNKGNIFIIKIYSFPL